MCIRDRIYLRSNLPNLFKIRRVLRKLWRNTFWCVFLCPTVYIYVYIVYFVWCAPGLSAQFWVGYPGRLSWFGHTRPYRYIYLPGLYINIYIYTTGTDLQWKGYFTHKLTGHKLEFQFSCILQHLLWPTQLYSGTCTESTNGTVLICRTRTIIHRNYILVMLGNGISQHQWRIWTMIRTSSLAGFGRLPIA